MKTKQIIAAILAAATLAGAVPAANAAKPTISKPMIGCRIYSAIPLEYCLQRHLILACNGCDVPLEIALAVIDRESNFDPASEYTQSVGLMGIPKGYNELYGDLVLVSDLHDTEQNITAGIALLAHLHELYGCWSKALTAYAVGERAAEQYCFPYGPDSDYSDCILALADEWAARLN